MESARKVWMGPIEAISVQHNKKGTLIWFSSLLFFSISSFNSRDVVPSCAFIALFSSASCRSALSFSLSDTSVSGFRFRF